MNQVSLVQFAEKLATQQWMLSPKAHDALCKQLSTYLDKPYPIKFEAKSPEREYEQPQGDSSGESHALIYVNGVLSKNVSPEAEMICGLVDVDWIRQMLLEAANDPTVKDIILCWNSPGGECTGVEELGRLIVKIDAEVKPVYSWCENQMDSAAYWLGSQTRTIGMTPSAQVGAVGVYLLVSDESKRLEREGKAITAIASGKYKLMGHEFRALTDEETEMLTKDTVENHENFKNTVLSRRPEVSRDDMEGLSFKGVKALNKHFVDYLSDSLEEFLGIIESQ